MTTPGQEEKLQPFPAHALAPIQREMAEALARNLSIEPDLPYMCTLAATSAACGRSLMMPSGPSRELGANLYLLGAAPSGLGKSSVFKPCFAPIHAFEADRASKFIEVDRPELVLQQMKLKKDIEIYKRNLSN